MVNMNRRDFVKVGASGLALGALSPMWRPWMMTQKAYAAGPVNPKKLLVIFMRGGNDGVNTVIPQGDTDYNTTTRPTLFIPDTQSLDLGNSFARLHPAMSSLHNLFNLGDVALIHRVGYDNQSRSHFSSQQYWETGNPGDASFHEGFLYRYVVDKFDLDMNPLAAVSLSNKLMEIFSGQEMITHFPAIENFTLDLGPIGGGDKLLGLLPDNAVDPPSIGSGMLGWYGQSQGSHGHDALIKEAGVSMGLALNTLQAQGVDPSTYVPAPGAVYPDDTNPAGFPAASFPFFQKIRDAAILLKNTDLRIAGVELDGFDTHAGQGAANGAQAALLSYVSHAIEALSIDLASTWDDTLVVTLSEFGRTSEENGSVGTDHGESSCMVVAGGGVNGGVYNCDPLTWPTGSLFSTGNGRYVERVTDFRAVFGEILNKFYSVPIPELDEVFPGYSTYAGDPTFNFLNFLP
ncbi:MAG: DUF1501 domain-containing protein [Planctomycetota bacterium]